MKYYLTTPIYYVNGLPHIGHAYTTVAADVISRWQRIHNLDVFFLTGTDEHGAKIVQAAQKNNLSPKEFCDKIVEGFKNSWQKFQITNNDFIRTTDQKHEKTVQSFLQKLFESGAVYKSKYEGLYCIQCEKFISESELDQNGHCPDHKQKPILHSEENYFFKLSAYRDKLLEILSDEKNPMHIAVFPIERRNEIIGKLKLGLEDISISRASLQWGVPLPFDKSQTAYVWIDALLNYISAIGYENDNSKFQKLWPADLHLMAKDILWFHSVIWPAMLLAADMPLPKKLFAHGFFTIEGQKMSKTIGNVIRPEDIAVRFGVEAGRYLMLSLFPFGTDGDISWNSLTDKYNNDLANNLGNLISRTLTMVEKYFNGTIPEVSEKRNLSLESELNNIEAFFKNIELHRVIEQLQKAIDLANRHIEKNAPWKMAKENNPDLPEVIFDLLQSLGIIAIYLLPFMPETSQKIWEQIGEIGSIEDAALNYFQKRAFSFPHSGNKTKKYGILFPRINNSKNS